MGHRPNGYENSMPIQIKFKLSKLTLSTANVKNRLKSCMHPGASHVTAAGEKMLGEQ